MKKTILLFTILSLLSSCRNNSGDADAYGNFEATEIIVSAETSGRLLESGPAEGERVRKGDLLAIVDTTFIRLQMAEADATMKSIRTRISSVNAQNEILEQQIANTLVNIERIENMLKDEAATRKQHDDLTGQVAVFRKQIIANNTQKESVLAELGVVQAKKSTLEEQLRRSSVKAPCDGTIIAKYAEKGELTAAGKPLAKIADLSGIILKVYISGSQLGNVKIGQKCRTRIDDGEKGYREYEGTIRNIAEKAEFTPKIIQTKEERVTMVYAIEIAVPNDGSLKSGMPGEALFN